VLPFDLPKIDGDTNSPVWNGNAFTSGQKILKILEYSENFSGWSDDLTTMHEQISGDSHPIDLASRNDAIVQLSKAGVKSKSVIMEIGCSSGFLLRDLVKFFPWAVIIGADVVRTPLLDLADKIKNIPLIRFDLLQNPLPSACIDVLILLNVLEHIEDDNLALKNAFELLKPGGTIILEVPACQWLYDAYDSQLHHYRRYSASGLKSKLKQAGFVVTRASHLGFLIFPIFIIIKLLNRFRKNSFNLVQDYASSTSKSKLLSVLLGIERGYFGNIALPFGIRVLMTARKPN